MDNELKIKSNTKNLLSKDQIQGLVSYNFGGNCEVGNIVELEGGMFNATYLIERPENQDRIVLKVSTAPGTRILPYQKDSMRTEVAIYKLIEEKLTIPAPRILKYDFSRKLISSDYLFMTELKGTSLYNEISNISNENLNEIKKEIAGYFAQFHKIKGDYFGYFTTDKEYRFATWKEAFLHMIGSLMEEAVEQNIMLPYDRIEKVLKEKSHYLNAVREPVLVEGDLWAGNVFLVKKGERYVIEGVIDFELAFWGDPLADFVMAAYTINDIHEEKAFWNVYKQKVDFGRDLTIEDDYRIALFNLYLYMHYAAESFRYESPIKEYFQKNAQDNLETYIEKLEQMGTP